MPQLLHDRYLAYDDIHGCDLATGNDVRLDALPQDSPGEDLPALVELLNDARDGSPRWIALDVRSRSQAAGLARCAAIAAQRRGFVPIIVPMYERLRDALASSLGERTLLLIGSFAGSLSAARAALVDAAVRTPRPHLLLTFRTSEAIKTNWVVREARAAYGAQPSSSRVAIAVPPGVARHVERAARATEFQRSGRHAAAERLLRDVAGALTRREAWGAASQVLVTLARLLLERGRTSAADKACAEAAEAATAGADEGLAVDARIWQAIARSDAARLTDAESICRAVLLTTLSAYRERWARAVLARVLFWQDRVQDALACLAPHQAEPALDGDPVVLASIDSTAVRALLAGGDVFHAGLRARLMLERPDGAAPLARVVSLTVHLRVLAEAGDLHGGEQTFHSICALATQIRAPWRAVRARLIWHDALRRAGRTREAQRQLDRMARMRRIAPALLGRAIDSRLACVDGQPLGRTSVKAATTRESSIVAALVHLAHEEDDDAQALQRVLERTARELSPSRIDLVSSDAGPASTLKSIGAGLATHIGERVLEAGIAIREEVGHGARETGVPVRLGTRLLGALVCRWPLDREPPSHAADFLALVAAIIAPRVDALITGARDTSRASASVGELLGVSYGDRRRSARDRTGRSCAVLGADRRRERRGEGTGRAGHPSSEPTTRAAFL